MTLIFLPNAAVEMSTDWWELEWLSVGAILTTV